jgi:histone H4
MNTTETEEPKSARGRGKYVGLGKNPLRLAKMGKPAMQGVTKSAIRRLARRGGVRRMSTAVNETVRETLRAFLTQLIQDSIHYAEHARRKTVTAIDVVYAVKKSGRMLYGFGV